MGSDKAFLKLGDKTFLERAATALQAISQKVFVVGNNLPTDLFLPVVADVYENGATKDKASIIGLYSALTNSKSEWTAVLACDLPFITGEFFSQLAALGNLQKNISDVILPVQRDNKIQPLSALYKTETCLSPIEKMIAAGNFRLSEIFEHLKTRRVSFSEIEDLPNAENFFFNVNTTEDLKQAEEVCASLKIN